MRKHICPWWLAYTFDNPARRLIHKPERIFASYLHKGMSVLDIGCGLGYFSICMARIVGDSGRVIAVDVQRKMLDILMKRAAKAGVAGRISPVLCDAHNIGITDEVDFVLAFWMAHETPDQFRLFEQIAVILKKNGKFLLTEPKMHVSAHDFKTTLSIAEDAGFAFVGSPEIIFSHSALFEKKLA